MFACRGSGAFGPSRRREYSAPAEVIVALHVGPLPDVVTSPRLRNAATEIRVGERKQTERALSHVQALSRHWNRCRIREQWTTFFLGAGLRHCQAMPEQRVVLARAREPCREGSAHARSSR